MSSVILSSAADTRVGLGSLLGARPSGTEEKTMSQKRNTNGRKRTPGGRPGGSGTAVAALLVRFDAWYRRHLSAEPHDEVEPEASRALLETLFARSNGALRVPAASTLEELLTEVDADLDLAPRMPEVVDVLQHYLDFVIETGAWTPSDAALEQSEDVLSAAYMLSAGLLDFLLESLSGSPISPSSASRRYGRRPETEPASGAIASTAARVAAGEASGTSSSDSSRKSSSPALSM
jgi:hypothetical protein